MRHIVIRLAVCIIWLIADCRCCMLCAEQLSLCRTVCCFGYRLSSQRLYWLEKGKEQAEVMRWRT